jgi:hypothetical protein
MNDPIQTKLRDALDFATDAHKGQKRKTSPDPSEPPPDFITHPIAVMTMVMATESESFHSLPLLDCMIIALLHDVIEDTKHTRETLTDAGFGQWVDDIYVLSRRKPQECERCAPQWDITHKVTDECRVLKGNVGCCQTNWDYIRAIREYAIDKADKRGRRIGWRYEPVIRVKKADVAHNMETSDMLSPTMGERYEKGLHMLLTEGE